MAVAEIAERAALSVAGALLPAPESRRLAARHQLDLARTSAMLGAIEAPLGIGLFFDGAIAYVAGGSPILGRLLLENWFPGLSSSHIMGTGLIALFAWFLHPLAWLLALVAATGVVRLTSFALTREPVGEPLVWAVLRSVQLLARLAARGHRARRLGPWRPDRLHRDRGSDLEIVSCRPRPEWEDGGTLEVEGRFYRLVGAGERDDGPHRAVVYRFRELDERELIRNPIPYRPLSRAGGATPVSSETS